MSSKRKLIKELRSLFKNPKSIFSIVLIISFLIYQYYQDFAKQPLTSETVSLSRCVDGDTAKFTIDGEEKSVRFLAIDTPETVKQGTEVQPYGKEASTRTCNLLTTANDIKLEYESEKVDKYKRTLAWVWADDTLIQLDLIEEGYAQVKYLYDDYKYTSLLQDAQSEAKEKRKGLWNE